MTTRIAIEADVSTATQQINDLKQNIASINSSVKSGEYKLDTKQAEQDIKTLLELLDRLERSRDKMVGNNTLSSKQSDAITKTFNQSASVVERVNTNAGVTYTPPVNADAGGLRTAAIENEQYTQQARQREQQQAQERQETSARYRHIAQAVGSLAGAAMGGGGAMGTVGGLASGQLGGIAGGLIGGVLTANPAGAIAGSLIGSTLGGAVGGKLGGMADSGLSDAEQEAASYTQLRHSLNSATVDFDRLRDVTRTLTEGFGVAYNESAQLAKEFSHAAASSGEAYENIGKSLHDALGTAQAYGVAPQATTQFLATEQLYHVTNNETDNKRLALQIGEAVNRSGTNAKYDEVLAAITHFTKTSAHQSLLTPDVSAFTSLLSNLMGSSFAGLNKNPEGAADLIGKVDAGFRGASSESQNNLLASMINREIKDDHFSPADVEIVKNAGAMSSFKEAFGKDTPYYQQADEKTKRHLDKINTDDEKFGAKMIRQFEIVSGGSSESESILAQNQYGITIQEYAAYKKAMIDDKGFETGEADLKKFGIDIKKIETRNIPELLHLAHGTDKDFSGQYAKLLDTNKITPEKKQALDKLESQEDKTAFKKAIMELTLKNSADTGQDMLKVQADMRDGIQQLVKDLIPLTTDIKGGIVELINMFDFRHDNAFVARMGMQEKSQQLEVKLDGKNGAGDEALGQVYVNSNQSLGNLAETINKTKGPLYADDAAKELIRDSYTKERDEVQSHPENYVKEQPKLIKKLAKDHGIFSSATYKDKEGKEFKLDYGDKTGDNKPITVNAMENADKAVEQIIGKDEGFWGGIPETERPGRIKRRVEFIKKNFDTSKYPADFDKFLDNIEKNNGDVSKLYTTPKPKEPEKIGQDTPKNTTEGYQPDATLQNRPGIMSQHAAKSSKGFNKLTRQQQMAAAKVINEAANQGNTPEEQALLLGLVDLETRSTFDENIENEIGAYGLFQIMPGTAKDNGVDRKNAYENIKYGVSSINKNAKTLHEKYGLSKTDAFDKAMAAHITGFGRDEYHQNKYPPASIHDANGTTAKSYVDTIKVKAKKYLNPDHGLSEVIQNNNTPKPVKLTEEPVFFNPDDNIKVLSTELQPSAKNTEKENTTTAHKALEAVQDKPVDKASLEAVQDKPIDNPQIAALAEEWQTGNKQQYNLIPPITNDNEGITAKLPRQADTPSQKQKDSSQKMKFLHQLSIALTDPYGNQIAAPVVSEKFGAPTPIGHGQ